MNDYNLTAATIAALAADARSFDTHLTASQLAIDANKIKKATAQFTLNNFLEDALCAGMKLLKDSHPKANPAKWFVRPINC